MTDQMRAMLDEMMGVNRNGDKPEEAALKHSDARLCRPWLCGMCPHEIFAGTRADMGPCPKKHDVGARKSYVEDGSAADYSAELISCVDEILGECRRRVESAERKRQTDGSGTISIAAAIRKYERDTEGGRAVKARALEAEKALVRAQNQKVGSEALAKVEIALEEALHARARAHALVVSNEFRRIEVAQSAVKAIESSALAEEQKQQESAKVDMDEATAALIADKLKRAEEAGEEGDVDLAEQLTAEADALKEMAASKAKAAPGAPAPAMPPPAMPPPAMPPPAMPPPAMPPPAMRPPGMPAPAMPPPAMPPPAGPPPTAVVTSGQKLRNQHQLLRVCDVCASMVALNDTEERLADHFCGRLHLGYLRLADAKEAAQAKMRQCQPARGGGRERERERDGDRRGGYHPHDRDRYDYDYRRNGGGGYGGSHRRDDYYDRRSYDRSYDRYDGYDRRRRY